MSTRYQRYEKGRYDRRKAIIDKIKLDSGCVDCGFNGHAAALHFDHRDRSTKSDKFKGKGFAMRLSCRWSDILAEIAKCDVRCANCHAIRHAKEHD